MTKSNAIPEDLQLNWSKLSAIGKQFLLLAFITSYLVRPEFAHWVNENLTQLAKHFTVPELEAQLVETYKRNKTHIIFYYMLIDPQCLNLSDVRLYDNGQMVTTTSDNDVAAVLSLDTLYNNIDQNCYTPLYISVPESIQNTNGGADNSVFSNLSIESRDGQIATISFDN